ncbi:hypothetical protein R1sor_019158 [Riccia sorocarpa]|uniref:Uncharacterized protein n=1 Tax=Riccia sorocarpa TaxID=122646 RepID=A0ABD3ICB2_9MARC
MRREDFGVARCERRSDDDLASVLSQSGVLSLLESNSEALTGYIEFMLKPEAQRFLDRNLHVTTAPGPDALPVEFFLIFCDIVAPTLLRIPKQGLQDSQLPPSFTAGRLSYNTWGGANISPRQRIAHKVLQLPKSTGGLGLLAAKHQASTFASATITWALSPGRTHPLKLLIRAKFAQYANTKWGATTETAILHTRKPPHSIRGPKMVAVRTKAITAKSRGHQALKEADITQRKHIADCRGQILDSQQISNASNLNRRAMVAYQKIKAGIVDWQGPVRISRATLSYYTSTGEAAGLCIAVRSKTTSLTSDKIDATNLQATYKVLEEGLLIPHEHLELPQGTSWTAATIIPTSRGRKGNRRLVLTHHYTLEASMAKMQWTNGNDFFYFTNSHIRHSLTQDPEAVIKRNNKWKHITPFKEKDMRRWIKTWQASFLWLVIHSAIATNRFGHFPAAPRADPSTWCTRCDSNSCRSVIPFWGR